MKHIKPIIILVLLISLCLWACETKSVEAKKKTAPHFSLTDLAGNTISLNALRGKVVLINFFATWCGPCRAEVPHLVHLYKKYNGQGLAIIGIALDQGRPEALKKFLAQHDIQYPVALATKDIISNYGGISAIPMTIIVDQDGIIEHTIIGLRPGEMLEKLLTNLLKK